MAANTTKAVEAAAQAHTNLTMFHAIIALAESGGFYGYVSECERIIATAKRGAARQLKLYDQAVARAAAPEL